MTHGDLAVLTQVNKMQTFVIFYVTVVKCAYVPHLFQTIRINFIFSYKYLSLHTEPFTNHTLNFKHHSFLHRAHYDVFWEGILKWVCL